MTFLLGCTLADGKWKVFEVYNIILVLPSTIFSKELEGGVYPRACSCRLPYWLSEK